MFVCFKANLACISPSSLISFASDQRPLPGPLSSTAVPPPGRHDCLTDTLGGGPSPPPPLLTYRDWLSLSQCVIATSG